MTGTLFVQFPITRSSLLGHDWSGRGTSPSSCCSVPLLWPAGLQAVRVLGGWRYPWGIASLIISYTHTLPSLPLMNLSRHATIFPRADHPPRPFLPLGRTQRREKGDAGGRHAVLGVFPGDKPFGTLGSAWTSSPGHEPAVPRPNAPPASGGRRHLAGPRGAADAVPGASTAPGSALSLPRPSVTRRSLAPFHLLSQEMPLLLLGFPREAPVSVAGGAVCVNASPTCTERRLFPYDQMLG